MIEDLKRRIGEEKNADIFLKDAKAIVELYTGINIFSLNENEIPAPLKSAIVRLAVVLYNREGIEGEAVRNEGGVARTMEAIPTEIEVMLKPYRRGRVLK